MSLTLIVLDIILSAFYLMFLSPMLIFSYKKLEKTESLEVHYKRTTRIIDSSLISSLILLGLAIYTHSVALLTCTVLLLLIACSLTIWGIIHYRGIHKNKAHQLKTESSN